MDNQPQQAQLSEAALRLYVSLVVTGLTHDSIIRINSGLDNNRLSAAKKEMEERGLIKLINTHGGDFVRLTETGRRMRLIYLSEFSVPELSEEARILFRSLKPVALNELLVLGDIEERLFEELSHHGLIEVIGCATETGIVPEYVTLTNNGQELYWLLSLPN